MKKGLLNRLMALAVFAAITGCSTVPVQQLSDKYDRPILSAAQIDSMIRVEVTELAPVAVEETVVAAAGFERR